MRLPFLLVGLFDHDFGKPAAEVFAFIGYGQRDIEGGLAVDGGNFGLLLLHLLAWPLSIAWRTGSDRGSCPSRGTCRVSANCLAAVAAENGFGWWPHWLQMWIDMFSSTPKMEC